MTQVFFFLAELFVSTWPFVMMVYWDHKM